MLDAVRGYLSTFPPVTIQTIDVRAPALGHSTISDDLLQRATISDDMLPSFSRISLEPGIEVSFTPAGMALLPLARFGSLFVPPTRIVPERNPEIEQSAETIANFFGAEDESDPPTTSTVPVPQPVALSPLRDFLQDELADELGMIDGLDSLRRLFWSLLGYERVDSPLPEEFFPLGIAKWLLSATIFAQHEGLRILLVQAKEGRFHEKVRRAVLNRASTAWGQVVVLFCDYGWKKIALGFQSIEEEQSAAFIRLAPLSGTADHQARRIAPLRTHTREDVRRPLLDICASYRRLVEDQREAREDREAFAEVDIDPDELYYGELSRHDVMSDEESRTLLERIASIPISMRKSTRYDEYESCRNSLLTGHWRLCGFVIKHYRLRRRCHSLSWNDLMQEGILGLAEAIDHFDVQHETKFSTYAHFWIRQSIQRGIHKTDRMIRIPAYCYSEENWLPSEESKRLRWILSLSLFGICPAVADAPPADIVQIQESQAILPFLIEQGLRHLSQRERSILASRFGLQGMSESTLMEIGDRLGITRERIRQIERDALEKLRNGPCKKQLAELLSE